MKSPSRQSAILLLSCPDRPGIVAEVSHFISTYGGNIIRSDQHSDEEAQLFFMRVEWDLAGFQIPAERIQNAFEPVAHKFAMQWTLQFSQKRARVALFVSKMDHCLLEILLRHRSRELNADLAMVIGNHEDLKSLAESYQLPFSCFEITKENKREQEEKTLELLKAQNIDLIVLARYMQILSPEFVRQFDSRIINIHHSFLPAFVGAKPYHQAYLRGVKIIGATSHYVTQDLDQGPIIEQDVIRISHRDSVEDLIQKGKNLEKTVLAKGLTLHLEHKVLVYGNKTVVFE